jgi:uncharacterized protein (TIGR03067 family)
MGSSVVASLVSGLLWGGLLCDPDSGEPKTGLNQLRGSWKVVDAPRLGPIRLVFDRDKVTIVFTETFRTERRFKIDPKARPRHIDILHESMTVIAQGIYEVSGNTLRICVADFNTERPARFKAGKKVVLLTLTRQAKTGRCLRSTLDSGQRAVLDALLAAGVPKDDPAVAAALKFVSRSSIPAR